MGRAIVAGGKPAMEAPVTGIALADIAEGSIVKLNENGSPVEFYVAKHDYESGLNGAGRTLLVRKDCYDIRNWHSDKYNAYASCALDSWLNGTYKALLDSAVQSAMGTTKFRYTPGNGNTSVTTLSRAVFALSVTELSTSATGANTEGSALPIASTLKIAYLNGSAVIQWTRTPYTGGTTSVCAVNANGNAGNAYESSGSRSTAGSRPCFTLPSTTLFDAETMILKGVA